MCRWIPRTNTAKVFRRNITSEPVTETLLGPEVHSLIDYHLTNPYYSAALQLEAWFPSLLQPINQYVLPVILGPSESLGVKKSYETLMGNFPDMYEEIELHIPLAQFHTAFNTIATFINTTTDYTVNFIVGVRFMPQDTKGIWLVPSYDGPCVAIAVMFDAVVWW